MNTTPLKIDGWKMIFFFWTGPFSGDMLIPGGVGNWVFESDCLLAKDFFL